ncbi:MarR family winged helix-turn-helix transcriptional regulator [Schaalia hyovaginalis]|uniref:MarR family winged helix-turn-helix transcriptional regulator n=1 Tax=Schaalia hyovaginalis TaxID=29316 RepID=UPI0039C227FE
MTEVSTSSILNRVRFADEVAGIVAAWSRERPDLDSSPMLVLSRVSRLARRLDLERRKAFADHGLEPWEFDVLSSLRRAGSASGLTPGALMAELLVSSGTMTNRIDRLESKGLVSRSPSPQDRRVVLVTLTEPGRTRVDGALASLLACEEAILAPLDEEARHRLADLLTPLLLPFEAPACEKGRGRAAE